MLVGSRGSCLFKMAVQVTVSEVRVSKTVLGHENILNTSLTDDVVLPKIPTVSRELAYATTPHRESNPYDGLNPTVPVYAAGSLTEPPVSVPSALEMR